ncbi:MAG: HigA family addiction module antitoxin [Roseiarcus sp.]|jgi:addiction module HigA family antidote
MARSINPSVHPGEILREEFLAPLGMSAGALAKRLNVPRTRIERLVAETTAMTPDTALRLGKFFATSPEFWMNLQTAFDLTAQSHAMREEIAAIEEMRAA